MRDSAEIIETLIKLLESQEEIKVECKLSKDEDHKNKRTKEEQHV